MFYFCLSESRPTGFDETLEQLRIICQLSQQARSRLQASTIFHPAPRSLLMHHGSNTAHTCSRRTWASFAVPLLALNQPHRTCQRPHGEPTSVPQGTKCRPHQPQPYPAASIETASELLCAYKDGRSFVRQWRITWFLLLPTGKPLCVHSAPFTWCSQEYKIARVRPLARQILSC